MPLTPVTRRLVIARGISSLVLCCLLLLVSNNFKTETPTIDNVREKVPMSFLSPSSVNKFDYYAAAWWQSIPRFLEMEPKHIHSLEDATFKAIRDAGNKTQDIRMTKNWIAFAVEHFSAYNRGLTDDNATSILHRRLSEYAKQTNVLSNAMKSTIAIMPYRGCDRDFREELRVSGGFCQVALEATVASLVRQGIGRVVVVTTEESDREAVESVLGEFRRRFALEFVCILTSVLYDGKVAHVPKTALMGLSEALQFQNTTWIGSSASDRFEYVYFTEPDQLLVGELDSAHEAMDYGGILVPHRLEAIQHWSDFDGTETTTAVIPPWVASPVHNLSLRADRCCDAGRIPVRRCAGQHKWFVCPFPPNNKGFGIFKKHEFIRIADGSGLTLLTTQGVDQKPSYCRPNEYEC